MVAAIPPICPPGVGSARGGRPGCWRLGCGDDQDGGSGGCVLIDADIVEAGCAALRHERLGLLVGPAVAGEPGGAGTHLAFDREESPSRDEYPSGLGEPGSDVLPVVDGGQ